MRKELKKMSVNGSQNKYEDSLFSRIFNIVISLVLLFLLLPLLLIISLLIKIDGTGGCVLLKKPDRVGKNRKKFRLYKFRYMVPDAHQKMLNCEYGEKLTQKWREGGGKLDWKEDPRITIIGGILRRTDMDELPQLWNVIRGDMNLVGPRPYIDHEVDEFKDRFPEIANSFDDIFSVRPGITGLWQVSGRNMLPVDKRIQLDAECARRKSFWFDLWILLRTPWVVLTRKGAR